MKELITLCDLENLFPFMTDKERIENLSKINAVLKRFHVNNPYRIASFFAQLCVETDNLKTLSNFNEEIISKNLDILANSLDNEFYPFGYFWNVCSCNDDADVKLLGSITKKVNGGFNNSEERVKLFYSNLKHLGM